MWRWSCMLLKEGLTSTIVRSKQYRYGPIESNSNRFCNCLFSSTTTVIGDGVSDEDILTVAEAKKLMRLVNVDAWKTMFGTVRKEVIGYSELLQACENSGVAKSVEEAKEFASMLDEAGVVHIIRDKVYLHPDKVVDLVRRAVPLAHTLDDDPRREELKQLQAKQEEIDRLAHKHVRRILYAGLGFSAAQFGLLFRLTFWEFSWDVMEPITFFVTISGIHLGYAYFLLTSRELTYQDFMKRLFLSRRAKLMKKHNFDVERFMELQKNCNSHLDALSAKVYLLPDKAVDLVRRAVPLALTPDDDPREELKQLQAKQEEIDLLAHKHVRRILYTGFGFSGAQIGLFFRLTFWEFSWDVMAPITFFTATSGIIVGYAYFLITSKELTYQGFMKQRFLSRRKKLMKKHNFDVERFMELQKKCNSPLDASPISQTCSCKGRIGNSGFIA